MSTFALPSQSEQTDEAELLRQGELFDGLGRRKIVHPDHIGKEKPKLVGYTRATTFIGALEDTTQLHKWRTRLTLEGAADASLEQEALLAYERYLEAERLSLIELERMNMGQAKITKTALDEVTTRPGKDYRAELDEIAERAFFLGGGRDAADYGTALHKLVEQHHNNELTSSIINNAEAEWAGISLDLSAYISAWTEFAEATGARVVQQEVLVVDDKMKIAGRTDLVVLAKLPGDLRARRIIVDLKTGKIDNGTKLSQQMALYAGSRLYDPETGTRTPLRTRQDVAIVAHVPRGTASAKFHLVQLAPGRAANVLCMKVREARRKQPGIVTELELGEEL